MKGAGRFPFSVNDGQAGAWFSWNSLNNDADASGIDALYTVQTDLGSFIPTPDGGNLVALIPSQGGTINVDAGREWDGGRPNPAGTARSRLDRSDIRHRRQRHRRQRQPLRHPDDRSYRCQWQPAAGGCYVLEDGGQVNQACDGDDGSNDGQTFMAFPEGLDPGNYTLVETRTPDGVDPVDDQQVSLDATDNVVQIAAGAGGGDDGTGEDGDSDGGRRREMVRMGKIAKMETTVRMAA